MEQSGAQQHLRSAAAVGTCTGTVHDLVANDSETAKEDVQGLGDSPIGSSARPVLDGVSQCLRGPTGTSAKAPFPIAGALHSGILPPTLPKGRMRLPKFEDRSDVRQVLTQYLPQSPSVVPSHQAVERASLHEIRGTRILRVSAFHLVGCLVCDPIEDKADVGRVFVRSLVGQVDPCVHARDAALVVGAIPGRRGGHGLTTSTSGELRRAERASASEVTVAAGVVRGGVRVFRVGGDDLVDVGSDRPSQRCRSSVASRVS